jgi:hypothetical protein
MATFRCLQSGNTVTFTQLVDIESMRGHQGYVRLDEDEQIEPEAKLLPMNAPSKKLGRPRKLTVEGLNHVR